MLLFQIKNIIILLSVYFLNSKINISAFFPFIQKKEQLTANFAILNIILNLCIDFIIFEINKFFCGRKLKVELIFFKKLYEKNIENNPYIEINSKGTAVVKVEIKVDGYLNNEKIHIKFPNWIDVDNHKLEEKGNNVFEYDISKHMGIENKKIYNRGNSEVLEIRLLIAEKNTKSEREFTVETELITNKLYFLYEYNKNLFKILQKGEINGY